MAHTWAIGVGKEFCASALLCLCDLGLPGGRSLDEKLSGLYADFRAWCYSNKESCKITEFSKKQVKITAKLALALLT